MKVVRVVALAVALVVAFALFGAWLDCRVEANPIERAVARVRVYEDGRQGSLRVGGTVDSMQWYPGAIMSARRDSAQLWVYVDGVTYWPADTSGIEPISYRMVDDAGNGSFDWVGKVDARGFYTTVQPQDGMQVGQAQAPFFFDDGAYVRVDYAAGVLVALTAWGTERFGHQSADSLGYVIDVGQAMTQSPVDSTRFYFTGGNRAGGNRYLVRTLAAWTSGANRWLRLEVVRDSAAIDALIP